MSKEAKYMCTICDKEFTELGTLRNHIQLHSFDNPYTCHLCPYAGKTRKYLAKHIKLKHVTAEAQECSYCGRKFHYLSQLREHLYVHTNSRPYKCDVCEKGFNSNYGLNCHKNIHKAEKPYKCLYCDYACNDGSTLKRHHDRHTGLQKVYQCEKCLRNFKRKSELSMHISEVHLKIDVKTIPCQHCGKMFKTKSKLTAHINRVHNKAYETKCEICGLYISNRYNLKKHLRSHINLKPFLCGFDGCGKGFKDKCALMKHSVIHNPGQQHACETCGRLFARADRLRAHMRQHRPRVKDVTCEHCGASFYSKNYLSKHIVQVHVMSARFHCDVCGFCAHTKPGLIVHIRAGHDPDLTCKLCKKVYKTKSYLKSHYWKTHFVRYKTKRRTKVAKTKQPAKEVKIKKEPIDDTPLENVQNNRHDITLDTEAEQAAKMKEMMMNAVIATSDNLETLFRDLLKPPDEEDDDEDAYDYPLLCDAKAEEEAQTQIREMLTKEQLSYFHGNRKKPIEKVNIPIYSSKDKSDTELESSQQNYREVKLIRNTVLLRSDIKKLNSDILAENKRRLLKDRMETAESNAENEIDNERLLNGGMETAESNAEDEIDNERLLNGGMETAESNAENKIGNDDRSIDKETNENETSKSSGRKFKKGAHKLKVKQTLKKRIAKRNQSGIKKIINNIRSNRVGMRTPRVYEAGEDITAEVTTKTRTDVEDSRESTCEDEQNEEDASEENRNDANQMGLILNSHQCYECFMLFDTKEKLLEHCKEHYNLCNDVMLKKCPFCDFVTHGSLPRHVKRVHKMDLKNIYSASVKEKENETGSRYFYKVDSDVVDKIDIIPSVKHLNKMAYVKLDRLRRLENNKAVQKTKLVKKQGEWVVEKQNIDIKAENIVVPDLKEIEGDHFESLKKMAVLAKKEGKKFMYPCKECEKICQNLSALKLHYRRHDPDKKPYKPKVWKHKMNGQNKNETKATEPEKTIDTNRYEKPKPVVNKHKCDPKLIEFYNNNIRGGDIEFWQFLKIYNRMDKDNVNDFKDLENTTKYGIHIADRHDKEYAHDTVNTSKKSTSNNTSRESNAMNTTIEISRLTNKLSKFKRVVMINRQEHIRRMKVKKQLREKLKQTSK